MSALTIGQVAKEAQVGIETIRYYERRKLVPNPPRKLSGYRQYPQETVQQLRFIKKAQSLGFTLDEIKELLTITNSQGGSVLEIKQRALKKLESVNKKIGLLVTMRDVLQDLTEQCSGEGTIEDCPIVLNLKNEADHASRF